MVTRATGTGFTVISDSPLMPSTVAMIRTGPPSARAVITPVEETDTTVSALDDQTIVRPGTSSPLAVLGDAVS